jgi:hypothetical protein
MDEKIVDLKIGDVICNKKMPDNICTVVHIDEYSIATRNSRNGAVISIDDYLGPLKEGDFYYYLCIDIYRRDFKHYFMKIPDTKLARRLYNNMIHKEEGGKLWIKPSQSLKKGIK